MESDREILMWFHERLVVQHEENRLYDYMHRLRHIIAATDPKKMSLGQGQNYDSNSLRGLKPALGKLTSLEKGLVDYSE